MKKITSILRTEFYIITALMTFMAYISNDSFLPAMEPIAKTFGTHISTVNLSMSALIAGICTAQIPSGFISDRLGRRPMILAGGLIFMIATFFITNIKSIELFMVCRFIQGMGCACIATTSITMINEYYHYKKRIFAIAAVSQLSILAPMMGPLLGAYVLLITDNQWQYLYIYNNYISLFLFICAWFYLPETLGKKHHLNTENSEKDDERENENFWQIMKVKSYTLLSFAMATRVCMVVLWLSGSVKVIMMDMGYDSTIYGYSQIPVFVALIFGNALVAKIGHSFLPTKYIKNHIFISIPIVTISFIVTMLYFNIYTVIVFLVLVFIANGSVMPIKNSVLLIPFKAKGLANGWASVIRSGLNIIGSTIPAFLYDFDGRIIIALLMGLIIWSAICGLLAIPHIKKIERDLM